MRLDKFDLNLLVAFDVLIEERNVTRAAKRLNLTQSAMSGALRRLRDAFSDDILVQQGKKMFPTPAALALAPEISAVVTELRGLLARGLDFDPATSERVFRIVASDYIAIVLFGTLLEKLQKEAPHIRIELTQPDDSVEGRLEDGVLDLIIAPERYLTSENPREILLKERHVVVGWSGNPLLDRPLSLEAFQSVGHVATSVSSKGTFAESFLREHSDNRRIEIVCATFNEVAWMLPGTMRLALMHERLANIMAKYLPLRICEPPVDLPVMNEMLLHHRSRRDDAGLIWLRRRMLDAANSI